LESSVLGFGDVGGTLGLVSGAFGGVGFDDGGGISGELGGIDGEAGGVCGAQPAVITVSAMAAKVDLLRFIFALLYKGLTSRH
jgi:hypothetical protein